MSSPIRRLFVNGFPSLYGGAGTELHHQIIVWRKMGVEVHLIPSWDYHGEPLYNEMVSLGVIMHAPADWSAVQPGDPVLGFCNAGFLNALPEIRRHTKRTVFINCMTWLFPREKEAMQKGEIAMFLYQNEAVRQEGVAQRATRLLDDLDVVQVARLADAQHRVHREARWGEEGKDCLPKWSLSLFTSFDDSVVRAIFSRSL